jgi:hypothetical protein
MAMQLVMFKKFSGRRVQERQGSRRTLNPFKHFSEVSKAITFFGGHRESLAESRKAK